MADVAASANDPIFLNHHAMVDCIFETWLQKNPNAKYPTSAEIPQGHRKQDYIVPFFPLYKHEDMFRTAEHFGYCCTIKPQTESSTNRRWIIIGVSVSVVIFVLAALAIAFMICCAYCKKKRAQTVPTEFQQPEPPDSKKENEPLLINLKDKNKTSV